MKHIISIARTVSTSIMFALILGTTTPALAVGGFNLTTGKALPPDAIGNLSMPYFTTNTVSLRWEVSSPDEDANTTYDIRYSTDMITAVNFASAHQAQNSPITITDLLTNGVARMYTVKGLTPGATYHFALKSKYTGSDWSDISDMPSMTLPTSAPTSSTFPNTDLGYGKSSASVSDLQKFLTAQGLYTGPITTYFGAMTKKAVIAFQIKNKITPALGYVGMTTRTAIQNILAAQK
jgi:hypothetical protein